MNHVSSAGVTIALLAGVWLAAYVPDARAAAVERAIVSSPPPPAQLGTLTARDSALHVLQRFAYGPRAGQVEEVARQGALAWLDAQLAADGKHDAQLAAIETRTPALALDQEDWAHRFVSMRRAAKQGMAAGERAETRELLDQVRALVVTRAVTADAQLREVVASFWFDHFNVFLDKGADRFLLPRYVEDVIRPFALGHFEDLLLATARSPAMLFYLDNVQSVAPGMPAGSRTRGPAKPGAGAARRTGINENYARELLELHTLGVDGGYTQKDVVAVARILTGWSMRPPALGGGFVFRPRAHDFDEKWVLGTRFPAGHGEDEGVRLLRMLARHPATVRHVCTQLCQRFVSDEPPDGCVDAAVAAWRASDGDIRKVVRAIARTPEFWSAGAIASKVKTPLEFVVSAVRALDAEPDSEGRLAAAVGRLGEPLYRQPSPAGYPERQEDWANSGALLARMTFAIALAAGHEPGAAVDLDAIVPVTPDRAALVDSVNARILGGAMSEHTRQVIVSELADMVDPGRGRALAVGLALGSPEFQRQ